jgi:tetratricopeptide (TPR) repeat protein
MPERLTLLAAVLLALSSACWSSRVHAQEPGEVRETAAVSAERKARAAALDREARQAFALGEFARAAELFSEAQETLPHPATRYNEAVARQRAGQRVRAAELLELVIAELPASDARRQDATERLAALGQKLSRLSLSTSEAASASIAHVAERPTPFVVYLEPGRYRLRVSFPGGSRERAVEVTPGEQLRLDVEAPAAAGPPPSAPPEREGSARKTWGLVTLGAGAAAGLASAVLGYSTLQALDDFDRSGHTDAAARDRAVRQRALTNVALGVGVVAAGVGVYLLLSTPEQRSTGSVSLRLGLDRADLCATF